MLNCANEMTRASVKLILSSPTSLCGRCKRPHCILSFWVSEQGGPESRGMVWGTSQGAWLDPLSPTCSPLKTDLGPPWWVPSHHFQKVTRMKTKRSSLRANPKRISASFHSSFWIVSGFLLCDEAHPCLDSFRLNRPVRSPHLPPC